MSQHNEAFASVNEFNSSKDISSKDISSKDLLFLTRVSFNEEKKEIFTEFSNKSNKFVQRFKFFPFLALPKTIDSEKVKDLLLDLKIKRFQITTKQSFVCVQASSVSSLKTIANALAGCLGKLPLVIEPERQFLLEKNWSYFDSFAYFNGSIVKVDSFKKDVAFSVFQEMSFFEAMRLDKEQALFLVERAALSSVLSVPMDLVPREKNEQEEIFLQNLFFRNAGFVSWEPNEKVTSFHQRIPFVFDKVSSIDFSPVWVQLFSKRFFNVGHETKNCQCCKPFTLEDKNLLPSSLIEVIFQEDDFFYESSSPSFSEEFDLINANKELRLEKKNKFFLTSKPIGPFSKGISAFVPLLDAKKLLEESSVILGKSHKPEWFCLHNESFFSSEIDKVSEKISQLSEILLEPQQSLFGSSDFGFLFADYSFKAFSLLVAEIPFQLVNLNSRFYSPSLAKTIVSIQEATLFKFREFSREKGYRVLHADKRSALIKGFSPLSLAKRFSQEMSLPQPQVKAFSNKKASY